MIKTLEDETIEECQSNLMMCLSHIDEDVGSLPFWFVADNSLYLVSPMKMRWIEAQEVLLI